MSAELVTTRLAELEAVIERGLDTFVEVGTALAEIRDGRLYRETHATFEAYCRERWGWTRRVGYQYIEAAQVAGNVYLSTHTPPSLTQARQLATLAPDEQRAAAAGIDFGTATAADVLRVARAIKSERRQDRDDERRRQKLAALDSTHPLSGARFRLLVADVGAYPADVAAGSVDAIVTDPPYPEPYIPLYGTLTRLAARLLRPGGHCLVMCGQSYLPRVLALLDAGPLTYRWTLGYMTPGQSTMIWGAGVHCTWKPVIWLTNGPPDWPLVADTVTSDANDKRYHEWGQSVSGLSALVGRFTDPGDLVLDPFVGGGSTAVAAVGTGRLFIGSDVDEACVKQTAARLVDVAP